MDLDYFELVFLFACFLQRIFPQSALLSYELDALFRHFNLNSYCALSSNELLKYMDLDYYEQECIFNIYFNLFAGIY